MDTVAEPRPNNPVHRLPELMLRDERRLRRRIDRARTLRDPAARQAAMDGIAAEVDEATRRIDRRRARVPKIEYPAELPVSQRKDDLLSAIRDHQVVIVAGETGSGKTTQLPKICLELGRGVRGVIGHTQPRRLAARTVAERIADELATPLGDAVGYQVRFTDRTGDDTMVKVMTDGILLAEIQHDRALSRYDTLIIDEAHERSLNIDFILGYVKQLLPRRPDLKVVVTSATIDPQRFSRHFGDAPVVEVSGRTYPVEVRYRPIVPDTADGDTAEGTAASGAADGDRDQTQAILDAVDELCAEGGGDILVFLSGEREIRDTADALGKSRLADTEIVPLYARLSSAEQHRVFQAHRGRRIVLATNVAETSLTVPGIRYVIDPGTARVSRYSNRLKVQRLPIEPISQASANQRKGRCGRVADGICVRLYSEADFAARPEFTDPEILRTNLASVILQMTAAGLGDIAAFPFIDPPDRRHITDGVHLLRELGALDPSEKDTIGRLTPTGRKLAQLPVDPRLARMVIESDRNGCAAEVMVIAAALSIQDPRERPADKQQAAAETHARFTKDAAGSDFLAYLALWEYLRGQQKELSSNRFRKMCKAEFLNYLRVREWQDVHGQLRQLATGLGITVNDTPADANRVHASLLAGLLSHVGLRDVRRQDYLGARGARFSIFPGSALFKKQPQWVMAAELVETSRLWARVVTQIQPEWIEPLAGHLVKRTYSEPHWERKRAAVIANERVTLYGIPIVVARKVNYAPVDPELARDLFIRHALVEGDWDTRHRFFHRNRELLADVDELEQRARRRDLLVDDETLVEFYDRRIPEEVVSGRHFDSWWKKTRTRTPDLLDFSIDMLVTGRAGEVSQQQFPDDWRGGELRMRLSYQFEPGTVTDGVTVHVPVQVLNQVTGDGFAWQVPGLREELLTSLIKSLPKPLRRNFVPAPDWARAALARMDIASDGSGQVLDGLERALRELSGLAIPRDSWQLDRVPEHLKVTYRVADDGDHTLAEGKDLDEIKRRLAPTLRATLSASAAGIERAGLRRWDIGTLPRTHRGTQGGYEVTSYPALADEGDSVAVRTFDTPQGQRAAMWRGTRRLLLLGAPSPVKFVLARLDNADKLVLSANPYRDMPELFDDCFACAVDKIMADGGGPAWDEPAFTRLADRVRAELNETATEVVLRLRRILAAANSVRTRLSNMDSKPLAPALSDASAQLSALVYRGFVSETGFARLPDVARYLLAIERRLEKLPQRPDRDLEWTSQIAAVEEEYRELAGSLPASDDLATVRWMIEELRVSLFAQTVKTAYPISAKRIYKELDRIADRA